MGVIVPAVLPTSRHDLEEKLRLLSGIADAVQIDAVDGHFAKPASWPYVSGGDFAELQTLPRLGEFSFEVDLMVEKPEEIAGAWIEKGASRITVHAESTRFLAKTMESLEAEYGHDKGFAPELLSFGLALNATTDPALVAPFLHFVDYVQFMGIRTIGRQGEPFDAAVVERAKAMGRAHEELSIQVDGGVSIATAPALLDAGVDRLVVGSALWRAPDLKAAYDALVALTERYGLYE